jgi:hypothetical protein
MACRSGSRAHVALKPFSFFKINDEGRWRYLFARIRHPSTPPPTPPKPNYADPNGCTTTPYFCCRSDGALSTLPDPSGNPTGWLLHTTTQRPGAQEQSTGICIYQDHVPPTQGGKAAQDGRAPRGEGRREVKSGGYGQGLTPPPPPLLKRNRGRPFRCNSLASSRVN